MIWGDVIHLWYICQKTSKITLQVILLNDKICDGLITFNCFSFSVMVLHMVAHNDTVSAYWDSHHYIITTSQLTIVHIKLNIYLHVF